MGYLNAKKEEVKFLDMDGREILIGSHIYPPAGGQELRVAWFTPNDPDYGDVLLCQQVAHLDTFSPLTASACAAQWKIRDTEKTEQPG